MKTLLVPVDFSPSAYNALRYAYQLAIANHSRLVLLNCYQIPIGHGNVMIDFKDILERDSVYGLQDFQERVQSEFGIAAASIEVESHYGYLADGVEMMLKKTPIDLIVMGTTGASNFVKKIFGSNTSQLLRRVKVPILAVPVQAEWKGWHRTIFASDFLNDTSSLVFNNFKKLINGMKITIDILHVIDKASISQIKFDKVESKFIADSARETLEFHYEPANNAVDGILTYTGSHPCDLLVMLKHRHGFLEELFSTSATRQLTLHSKNPVLLLQD
jgi:nucleotide-binding universal stress UspA family protein